MRTFQCREFGSIERLIILDLARMLTSIMKWRPSGVPGAVVCYLRAGGFTVDSRAKGKPEKNPRHISRRQEQKRKNKLFHQHASVQTGSKRSLQARRGYVNHPFLTPRVYSELQTDLRVHLYRPRIEHLWKHRCHSGCKHRANPASWPAGPSEQRTSSVSGKTWWNQSLVPWTIADCILKVQNEHTGKSTTIYEENILGAI